MKRILSLILAQLLVISMIPLFSFNVFAAVWTPPTLGLSTSYNLAGNTVTATVTISDYSALGELKFRLNYDANKVSYSSHTVSSLLSTGSATINNVTSPGYVSAVWSNNLAAGNSGSAATILVVTFNVVSGQSGTAAFSLTDCSFNDYTGGNPTNGSQVNSSVIIPEEITDINVSIAIPVKGNTPDRTVSGMGWTGTIEWTPAIFNKFVGGTVYTAEVTLTPAVHYKFADDPEVELNENPVTPSEKSKTRIVFSNTFEATTEEDLAISNQTLGGSLTVGEYYSASIVTTGGKGAKTFSVTSGTLPAGLDLNASTGVVYGTPSTFKNSTTNITVKVKDTVNTLGVSAVITIPVIGKADSNFVAPTGLTAVYGAVLSSVALPTGYSWTDGSISVGNVGTNYFPAKYNPDPANREDAFGNIYVAVSAKPLSVAGASANNRKYNGSRTISLTAVSLSGLAAGDTAASVSVDTALASGTLPSANAGTYETADLTGIVLKGTKAGNYTVAATADDVSVSVTITKANAPVIADQQLYFIRTQATANNTVDIAELLPPDRGTTTYATSSGVTYITNISVDDGIIEFDTKKASAPVSETITVEVTMRNYVTAVVEIIVNLTDQIVPTGTPSVTGTMVYGQKLSVLTIQVTMKDGTTVIPGTVVWDNPNSIPAVGAATQPWTFTPTDSNKYSIKKGNSAITVSKATPTITLVNKSSIYTGSVIEINTAVVVLANNETYNGVITYNYYTDLACTILTATTSGALKAGSAPIKSGTYYCKASIVAIGNYNAASSNVATLIITAPANFTVSTTAGTGGFITPKQTNVAPGGNVTLTITPNPGYKIASVKIDNVSVDIKSIYKLENVSQDHTVTVTFQKTTGTNEPSFGFIDVTPDAWYYDSVRFVFDEELMQGISSVKFDPQGIMTRAMLVTVLWRMEGSPDEQASSSFSDVSANQWYTDAVIWAAENGIVYGYENGAFGHSDFITREQMMTIFYRYSDYKGYDMTASDNLAAFKDAVDISGWALNAMKWAVGMNLIQGMTPTTVSPLGFATRAQVATILTRYV